MLNTDAAACVGNIVRIIVDLKKNIVHLSPVIANVTTFFSFFLSCYFSADFDQITLILVHYLILLCLSDSCELYSYKVRRKGQSLSKTITYTSTEAPTDKLD